MTYIFDKIILILLSVFILFKEAAGNNIVVALLTVILVAALNSFFEEKIIIWISTFLYAVSMLFLPELTCMVPVIFYDACLHATVIPVCLLGICSLPYCLNLSPFSICYFILNMLLGYYMNRKSARLEWLDRSVKQIRDDEEERNILLAEKNRHLIEKQDQEVYVATLKERNRIAREIHDNVGHILTRTILQMGALMTIHKEEPMHGQLTSVKDNLDVAMNNIRESVHDLHDESVDLKQAVIDIADGMKGHFDYHVEYDIQDKVDKQYKYAMIGIVREGVSNILKHSKNSNVDLILREHPGMYQLIIHDYTVVQKESPKAVCEQDDMFEKLFKGGGIGLQNIQDRASGLKGHVVISTDRGFRIFVTLPKRQNMGTV